MAANVTFRLNADQAKAVKSFLSVVDAQKRTEGGFKKTSAAARTADRRVAQVGRTSERTSRSLFTLNRAIGAAVGGFAGFITVRTAVRFLDRVRERTDDIVKDSKRLSIPADQLGKLGFAARQTGADTTGLFNAIRIGTRNATDALDRGLTTQVAALESIGLAAEDLTDSDGEVVGALELLERLSTALQDESGTRRLAFVQQFLGRSGASILPLLAEGPDAIRELADEAERFGAAITPRQAQAIEEITDALDRSRTSLDAIGRSILTEIEPVLVPMLDRLSGFSADFARGVGGFGEIFRDEQLFSEVDKLSRVAVGAAINLGAEVGILFSTAFFQVVTNPTVLSNGLGAWGRAIASGALEAVGIVTARLADLQEFAGVSDSDPRVRRLRELDDLLASQSRSLTDGNSERLSVALSTSIDAVRESTRFSSRRIAAAAGSASAAFSDLLSVLAELGEQAQSNADGPPGVPGQDEPADADSFRLAVSPGADFRQGVADIAEQLNTLPAAAQQAGRGIASGLSGGLADAVIDVADGTETVEAAFTSMVESILKDLARLAIRFAALRGLSMLFGIPGGQLPGLPTPTVATGPSGLFGGIFHDGGVVPGVGERMILAEGGERVLSRADLASIGSGYVGSVLRAARGNDGLSGAGGSGGAAAAAVAGAVSAGGGGGEAGREVMVVPVMVAGERASRQLMANGPADPAFMEAVRRNLDPLRAMLGGSGGGRR